MSRLSLALVLSGALAACGGAPPPEEHHSGDTLFTNAGTSGGEEGAPDAPISTGPAPLPLPTPPTPRAAMSSTLQAAWTRAEELLAERPPEAPVDANADVQAWISANMLPWLRTRMGAVGGFTEDLAALGSAPPYERAIGAALLGYVLEDTVADIRGMPVPPGIAADPELLTVYRETLDQSLSRFAEQAASGYQACALALDRHGDPSWGEWRAFCFERAEELEELYAGAADPDGEGE